MISQAFKPVDAQETWAVIILNWNTASKAVDCALSVDNASDLCPPLSLVKIIVDNNSERSDQKVLEQGIAHANKWQVTWASKNLGFAGGMNAGLQAINHETCDRVLFLNSDISLHEKFLASLYSHTQNHPQDTITGVQIRHARGGALEVLGGYQYFAWLGVSKRVTTKRQEIDYPTGAAFLCKSSFLLETNGIPTQNFLYFEELNLVGRLGENQTLGCCPEAIAWHAGGASTALILGNVSKHYYAAIACFRYTFVANKLQLPTVVLVRLVYLSLRSAWDRSLVPMAGGVRAFRDFWKEVL